MQTFITLITKISWYSKNNIILYEIDTSRQSFVVVFFFSKRKQQPQALPVCCYNKSVTSSALCVGCPGGGGVTPLFGLYGDVPLDRVWFFGLAVLNRVYNLTCLCPKRVKDLS